MIPSLSSCFSAFQPKFLAKYLESVNTVFPKLVSLLAMNKLNSGYFVGDSVSEYNVYDIDRGCHKRAKMKRVCQLRVENSAPEQMILGPIERG